MTTARNDVYALRAWTKSPGQERLRKMAAAQLRHMIADGWHETGRTVDGDKVVIRLERPATAAPQVHTRRREEGDEGGGDGGGGSRPPRRDGGGRGGGGGRGRN